MAYDIEGYIERIPSGDGNCYESSLTNKRGRIHYQRNVSGPFCSSTGELSSTEKIEGLNKKARTGQQIRLIDIPVDGRIIQSTHGLKPEQFARHLKNNCARHYGTAGPAFIQELIVTYGSKERLSGTIQSMIDERLKVFHFDNLSPEQQCAARRFALVAVAGELACHLDVVGLDTKDFLDAALQIFRTWRVSNACLPDAIRGVIAVQDFVQRHAARFTNTDIPHVTWPRCTTVSATLTISMVKGCIF